MPPPLQWFANITAHTYVRFPYSIDIYQLRHAHQNYSPISQAGNCNSLWFSSHNPLTFVIALFMQNPDLHDYFYFDFRVQHQSKRSAMQELGRDKSVHLSIPSIHRLFSVCPDRLLVYISVLFKDLLHRHKLCYEGQQCKLFLYFTLLTLVFDDIWLEVHYITVSSVTDHTCVLLSKRANPMLFPGVHRTIC